MASLTFFPFSFDQMFTNSSFYSLFQHNLNRYERNEVIRRIFASIVRFFWFFGKRFVNPDFFQSKTICIPRGIIPKNFSSLGLAMLKQIENKQSNKQIDSLTSSLFRGRVIISRSCSLHILGTWIVRRSVPKIDIRGGQF